MAPGKTKRGVRVDEIPAPELELVPEQAEGIKGGFDPQPDPPSETFPNPLINPIKARKTYFSL